MGSDFSAGRRESPPRHSPRGGSPRSRALPVPGQRSPTSPAVPWGDGDGMLLRDVGSILTPRSRGWLVPRSPRPRPGMSGAGAAACSLAPTPPWPRSLARATLPQGCVGQTQTPIRAEGSWAKKSESHKRPKPSLSQPVAWPCHTTHPRQHRRGICVKSGYRQRQR